MELQSEAGNWNDDPPQGRCLIRLVWPNFSALALPRRLIASLLPLPLPSSRLQLAHLSLLYLLVFQNVTIFMQEHFKVCSIPPDDQLSAGFPIVVCFLSWCPPREDPGAEAQTA